MKVNREKMKNKMYHIIGAMMLLGVALTACHKDSDVLMAYDHSDAVTFKEAKQSFAGKFKVTWNGLNQYYGIWDYEAEQGLDWDATYDEYLPKFEELDKRDKEKNPVTDDELLKLMLAFLSPLHDGHLYIDWLNHHTGRHVYYSPNWSRLESRDDNEIADAYKPNLVFYRNLSNGKVMTDAKGNAAVMEASTKWADMLSYIKETEGVGVKWIEAKIKEHEAKTLPTEHEVYQYIGMKNLLAELNKLTENTKFLKIYNELVLQYAYLAVPGLSILDEDFAEMGVKAKSALLKGNTGGIAYFYFSSFVLTPYLSANSNVNTQDATMAAYMAQVKGVWDFWFDNIQSMYKAGTLEGIIIDLRGNGGGMESDEQYVMGALMQPEDYQYGWMRFRRGTGRYEFSPLMPALTKSLEADHEVISDRPIVVLINSHSMSMSEMTATIVQSLPNGKVIGKRSAGGFCGLDGNASNSYNYAGYVGVEDVTPVYCYVPCVAEMDLNKNIREGVGVTPDIEVNLDVNKFTSTGEDTQLERAIEYIKTGK